MAEPTSTSPTTGSPAERDVLLATKLHIPRPTPGYLPRERLTDQLAEGTARDLTLVCAPAGFGKTSLVGEWARRSHRPVAWLSLDEGDNDPARLWRYFAAALDPLCDGVAEQVGALLRGPQPASLETMVTAVINAVADRPDRLALVLDDLHLVEAPPVHHSLRLLVDRLPAQLQLVLASRVEPPLPLARLRARGQLLELRAADLRFTPKETATLLRETIGLDLPASTVAVLAARTEGWAAGLRLAALSLRGHHQPDAFVAGFSGSNRYVLDYLAEEVLARQPDQVREFLLATSVLERLCGPLCDAVTGRGDGQAMLEAVERANLFLTPLDEVRGWWRYHQLFADLLRARLGQEGGGRAPQLHRNAAAWHEGHGLADEAIRHALAAGDAKWAAQLIERHVEGLYRRSEIATQQRWFAALPADLVRARPRLCLAVASWANIAGRLEDVVPLLDDAERAMARADEPFEPSVGRELSILVNVPAAVAQLRAELARQHGDPERAVAYIRRAMASLTEGDRALHALARWQLAMADWTQGRLPQAERILADVVTDRFLLSLRPWYDLGRIQQARGRLGDALRTFGRAVEIASEGGRPLPLAGMGHAGLADVLLDRGELAAALEHATQAVVLCRQLPYAQWLATALTVLAWVRQIGGDSAGAMAAMDEAERVTPSPDIVPDRLSWVAVQQARLALAQGRVADAARWTAGRGVDVTDEPSNLREPEQLVLAGVLLASDRADEALGLLEHLHDLAAAQGRMGSVIEVRALLALGRETVGDHQGALATLAGALTIGAPEGYVRVFVDKGPSMVALLRHLVAGRRLEQPAAADTLPREYLACLLATFEQAGAPVFPPPRHGAVAVPGLIDPLTARELEVLDLLAVGKPNQAIAAELVISLDTVKSHVAHIMAKLEVANRTQAVARARQLGLLP
jgi:LuxR family maltose regulon positive regulatory protein